MLRREEDRVWLDLDELYPPPGQQPNTVFKSLSIAFRAMGANTSYVDLMGLSAAAFRLQVGGYICPSSPHPHLGFSCGALVQEALGYGFIQYPWDRTESEQVRAATRAVMESVDRGEPAFTIDEETGLAVGYVDGGRHILVREPYSGRGDAPTILEDNWCGWAFSIVTELPREPARESVIRSLEVAVELARTEVPQGGTYTSGFAAYERWIGSLLDESYITKADIDPGAIVVGNAHIYFCLVDARRNAAQYLRARRSGFREGAHRAVDRTAALYDEIADTLDAGWENVPWPRQLKSITDWSQAQRNGQASLLRDALALERQAVEGLEEVLAASA